MYTWSGKGYRYVERDDDDVPKPLTCPHCGESLPLAPARSGKEAISIPQCEYLYDGEGNQVGAVVTESGTEEAWADVYVCAHCGGEHTAYS
jgi:hypothetical protein